MHGQLLAHKENAMHVVGHQLYSHHLNLRVIVVNTHPLALYGLPQRCQLNARFIYASFRCKGIADEPAEHWSAPFHFQCYHIHASLRIVVMVVASFHRGLLLACMHFLCCYLLVSHIVCKDRANPRYLQANITEFLFRMM